MNRILGRIKIAFLKRRGWLVGYKVVRCFGANLLSSHSIETVTYELWKTTKRNLFWSRNKSCKDGPLAIFKDLHNAFLFAVGYNRVISHGLSVFKCLYKPSSDMCYYRFRMANGIIFKNEFVGPLPNGKGYADKVILIRKMEDGYTDP